MKTLISLMCLVLFMPFSEKRPAFSICAEAGSEVNFEIKKDIFEYLEETRDNLEESVDGLSEEQMQFSPDAESWSVAEIMEHIYIVEGALKGMLEAKLGEEPNPDMKAEVKMSDEEVVGFITDRSQKIKTRTDFEPGGKFSTSEEAWEAFSEQRENIVDFLKDSDKDMRNYVNEFPFGKIDAYQTVLFLAGHTARHTDQIEEVKSMDDFPEE